MQDNRFSHDNLLRGKTSTRGDPRDYVQLDRDTKGLIQRRTGLYPVGPQTTAHNRQLNIIPPQRDGTQRPFGSTVVDLQPSIAGVTREGTPARERVSDRSCGFALPGQGAEALLHPLAQVVQ